MKKIGIDIVILPPKEIMEEFIKINQNSNSYQPLELNDYVPHISLCVAGIYLKDLRKLLEI